MNDGNGLLFVFIFIIIIFSYIATRRDSPDFIPGLASEFNATTPGNTNQNGPLSLSPTPVNPICNYPPSIPCQCIPKTAPIISCQNFASCPTGKYARTVYPGVDQLSVGCIYDMGFANGGYETFMNDPSCNISCP